MDLDAVGAAHQATDPEPVRDPEQATHVPWVVDVVEREHQLVGRERAKGDRLGGERDGDELVAPLERTDALELVRSADLDG